jgi:hypothetical protein
MPKQLNEFASDQPELGQAAGANPAIASDGGHDHEGAMAKADLYKLANYSMKLFKQVNDDQQLEAWVQAKITKAADYIASVYHYLEYEMKFSEYGNKLENSDMYSESEKLELKNKLQEAREMLKVLKLQQAERLDEGKKAKKDYDGDGKVESGKDEYLGSKIKAAKKAGKMDESMGGEPCACEACGGTGQVMSPAKSWSSEAKSKAATYNRKAKAYAAAAKRIDANKNGIPDDEEGAAAPAAKPASKKKSVSKKEEAPTEESQGSSKHSFGQGIYENEEVEGAKKAKEQNNEQDADLRDDDIEEGSESSTGGTITKSGDKTTHTRKYKENGKEDKINKRHGDNRDQKHVGQGGNMNAHRVASDSKRPLSSDDLEEGRDEGKPGKNFAKIAAKAGKKYGSKEAGERVAGAVRNKLKKAGKLEEGPLDAISNFAGDMFNTDASLERRSPQLQQLIAMRKKYPDGTPEAKQLDARIKMQKDRLSIDGSEVMGQGGMPKPVVDPATFTKQNPNFKVNESLNESAELTRMKEFLTRLNG